jgi:hypothetical protein
LKKQDKKELLKERGKKNKQKCRRIRKSKGNRRVREIVEKMEEEKELFASKKV